MVLAHANMGLLMTVYSLLSRYFSLLVVVQVFFFFCHFGSGSFCIWSKSVVYYFACIIGITVNSIAQIKSKTAGACYRGYLSFRISDCYSEYLIHKDYFVVRLLCTLVPYCANLQGTVRSPDFLCPCPPSDQIHPFRPRYFD